MLYNALKTYSPEELRGMKPSELMIMFEWAKRFALILDGKQLKKVQADIRLIRKILKG